MRLAYWLAGMSGFDAISHSFSTVSIGGFSTHDASIGFFDSSAIMAICAFFMVISGINFALHFMFGTIAKSPTTGQTRKRGCISIC